MQYYLEFKDDSSNKFWRLELVGSSFVVTFGKIGTAGQSQQKDFSSEQEAKKEAEKLANSKRKKGYVDAEPPKDAPAPKAKEAPPKPIAAKKTEVAPGPADVADDGKPKPWHDEEDEEQFDLEAMAEPDSVSSAGDSPTPKKGEKAPAATPEAFSKACAAGELEQAKAMFEELKGSATSDSAQKKLLSKALELMLDAQYVNQEMPAVVTWLLEQGAGIPKKYEDSKIDEKYVGPYRGGLSEYFFIRYGKNQDPARAKEIIDQYLEAVFEKAIKAVEERLEEYKTFKPVDNKRKNRFKGFEDLLDRRSYIMLGIEKSDYEMRSTEVPGEFWPYFFEEYKKNPDLTRIKDIWKNYLEVAFEEAAGVLAEKVREYADFVRAAKEDEDSDFTLTSTDGKIGREYSGFEISVFNEYWFHFYLEGIKPKSVFNAKTAKTSGVTNEFFARYAHLLTPHLEKLASEGVFNGLFELGGFFVKVKESPEMIFAWAEPGGAEKFEKTIKELEATSEVSENTERFIEVFPLLLSGAFGEPDEERAYKLLSRFIYENDDSNAEAKVIKKMYDWDDSHARVFYELAVYHNENLHFERARGYAKKAEEAGYEKATAFLQQMAREAETRKKLAGGEKPEKTEKTGGFDLAAAERSWKNQTFEKTFTEGDLYKKTDTIVARAKRDGYIYIRFLVEGEQGYSDALDFINNLLEKGYAHIKDGSEDGFALRVRFLIAPEFIPQMKKAETFDGTPYPQSDAHAFFARAVRYPALREKVVGYAERALNRFDYYLDLNEENGTVPGTFAAVALAFCGKEYFPVLARYATAVDDEHTYILPCVVAPLMKHYIGEPELAKPLFDIVRYSNIDEPFRLPKDLIWSVEFIERLLEYGGADEDDGGGIEEFYFACEGVYGFNTKATLKKAKSFSEAATSEHDRAVYSDFYNTYLASALDGGDDEVESMRPVAPKKVLGAEETAKEQAPEFVLEFQEVVLPAKEIEKRGEWSNEFSEKSITLFSPGFFGNYRTIENMKKQYSQLAAEELKESDHRRCNVRRWWGPLRFRYGDWAIDTADFPFECGIIIHDGKNKPFVLFGELDALALGIAATKRMPKTPEAAEELRRQHLIAESFARPKNEEWRKADVFFDTPAIVGQFLSDWDAVLTKRMLERITPQQGALIYRSARMMLCYIAERRGDAARLEALCGELAQLFPDQEMFWLEKQAVAKRAM